MEVLVGLGKGWVVGVWVVVLLVFGLYCCRGWGWWLGDGSGLVYWCIGLFGFGYGLLRWLGWFCWVVVMVWLGCYRVLVY